MLSFLFTILMLTLVFSVTAVIGLLFRKYILRGRESGMYYIWIVILILAVIPVRIGEPSIILFSNEIGQVNAVNADDIANEKTMKLSEFLKNNKNAQKMTGEDFVDPVVVPATANPPSLDANETNPKSETSKSNIDVVKIIAEHSGIIMLSLIIIWAAGFIFLLTKALCSYFKVKRRFYAESVICGDGGINAVFDECRELAGVNRPVSLRVLNPGLASPCVCGLANPTVFIDASCVKLHGAKLRYVFMHELYHIKRRDMLYKFFSLIIAGIHWFNPLAYKAVKAVNEDCELSVDRHIMDIFGNEQSSYYMNIILDIAETKCSVYNEPAEMYMNLFFGKKRNVNFLKRRYDNMKNTVNKKHMIITLSLFLSAVVALNVALMSSCGIAPNGSAANAPEEEYKYPSEEVYVYPDGNVYEEALKNYFNLLPDENITQEQLDEITDIKIISGLNAQGLPVSSVDGLAESGLIPVTFVINGRELNLLPSTVSKRVFDEHIIKTVIEANTEDKIRAEELWQYYTDCSNNYLPFDAADPEEYSREFRRVLAYYCLKDLNDPTFEPRDKAEMRLMYPIVDEYPVYIFDPLATSGEYAALVKMFADWGLLDNSFIKGDTVDASYLKRFPNLKTVTFSGITAANLDLPDTVNVINEDFVYTEPDIPVQSDSPSGTYTPPDYGMNTADDGTQYLVFENDSLRAAILEYLGKYSSISIWDNVTAEMLAAITSIEVKYLPEYDYVYGEDALLPKGMYLQYTINGESLDILPRSLELGMEGISTFTSGSFDINDYYDTVYANGEAQYYQLKSDLTAEEKLVLYEAYAREGLMRISLYKNENGEYFTVSENPTMYRLGFTARYYDKAVYNTADTQYMPNLTEFNVIGGIYIK